MFVKIRRYGIYSSRTMPLKQKNNQKMVSNPEKKKPFSNAY
jgi:hypothetical protein